MKRKADAIVALIDLDVSVDDNEMFDHILKRMNKCFWLTDFLFFLSIQNNLDYPGLIADIQIYVSSLLLKMKYGERNKGLKAKFVKKSHMEKKW